MFNGLEDVAVEKLFQLSKYNDMKVHIEGKISVSFTTLTV